MFIIYHSNQLDVLQQLTSNVMKEQPLKSPFEKEQILVQSAGMAQWLKLAFAKEQGIAANIDFPLPATFIWQLFVHIIGDVPKQNAFSKNNLCWRFMSLLPKLLNDPTFSKLQRYVENDDNQLKRYQLAQMLADLYDQYLVYRPDWIEQWQQGQTVPMKKLRNDHHGQLQFQNTDPADQYWQQQLWQKLIEYTKQQNHNLYHRANLSRRFINLLEQGDMTLATKLPSRVFIFGISSMAPQYLQLLYTLSKHIDIHFMHHNPTPYFWTDLQSEKLQAKRLAKQRAQSWIKGEIWQQQFKNKFIINEQTRYALQNTGNTLLASMGRMGSDLLQQLTDLEAHEIDAFVDIPNDTLLHQIQKDILNLVDHTKQQELANKPTFNQQQDLSLTLHCCHSQMREVEVLYDQLLTFFEQDPKLTPKDIVVMVSNIDQYAPFIQAIFAYAPLHRFIPFSISDRTLQEELPLIQAFFQLLNLPNMRCTQSEILSLLEVSAVANRFNINPQQFNKISDWLEQTNVRWGLDNETATEFDLPQQYQNSWLFGLQRMLLGYAIPYHIGAFHMNASDNKTIHNKINNPQDILGFDATQGLEAALVGELAHYINTLIDYHHKLQQPATVEQWVILLTDLIDNFFSASPINNKNNNTSQEDIEGVLIQIKQSIYEFSDLLIQNDYHKQPIPLSIVTAHLQQDLNNTQISQRFLAGKVNFCTLMPMRSIPFKIVCLLGMSDDQYPRNVVPLPLDLLNHDHRLGDRSRRDEDRYLFLEALLAAEQTLYISYIGRSINDNSLLPASVLVNELIRYCESNYLFINHEQQPIDFETQWMTLHPLTPFSPKAFSKEYTQNNISFATEWLSPLLEITEEPHFQNSEAYNESDNLQNNDQESLIIVPIQKTTLFEIPDPINLNDLITFWQLPVRHLLNKQYKIYFDPLFQTIEDSEPFSLNNLQQYQLKYNWLQQALLSDRLSPDFDQRFQQQQIASGHLPIGAIAKQLLTDITLPVKALYHELKSYQYQKDYSVHVHFDFSILLSNIEQPIHLRDRLHTLYHDAQGTACFLYYDCGSLNPKRLLTLWLHHLCCCAAGELFPSRLLTVSSLTTNKQGNKPYIVTELNPVMPTLAHHLLTEMIHYYGIGMQQPLPYFPDSIYYAVVESEKLSRKNDQEQCSDEQLKLIIKDRFLKSITNYQTNQTISAECDNPYIKKVWPQWNETVANQCLVLMKAIWLPLSSYIKHEEDL